jgi:hypothetical protein
MLKFCVILIVTCCSLAFVSRAQDTTNAPKTEIENFEAQTGTVIIKGFGQIGSVTASAGVISVRCKESATTTSHKEYGIAIEFASNQQRELLIVDYDEIDSLINGIDYLGKITYNVTSLPGFEATYTTKSGLRIVAYASKRQGGIQSFLQFCDSPRILLTPDQMVQLESSIGQAKTSLDSLRTK